MSRLFSTTYWNLERVTGTLLVLAFLVPIFMVILITVRGSLNDVFSQIQGASRNSFVRTFSLSGWILASLLSLTGLSLLTGLLQKDGRILLAQIAWGAMFLVTIFLILEATIHLTFGAWAAEEYLRSGSEPAVYQAVFNWASVSLQRVYVPIGYISLVLYGFSILQLNLLPSWSGWLSIAWGGGMFVFLIISGVTLPATLLIPGTVFGAILLIAG